MADEPAIVEEKPLEMFNDPQPIIKRGRGRPRKPIVPTTNQTPAATIPTGVNKPTEIQTERTQEVAISVNQPVTTAPKMKKSAEEKPAFSPLRRRG